MRLIPTREMHWTEGGPDYTSPDYLTDCQVGSDFYRGSAQLVRFAHRLESRWTEHGKPNIGPFPCGGMVTIHSQTGEITRSGQYWGLAHFFAGHSPKARAASIPRARCQRSVMRPSQIRMEPVCWW